MRDMRGGKGKGEGGEKIGNRGGSGQCNTGI